MNQKILTLFSTGRLEDAGLGCEEILEMNPANSEAFHMLGKIEYKAANDRAKAAKMVLRALEINPANPNFHHTLGKIFRELELIDEAIECFKAAIALEDSMMDAFLDLGKLYFEIDQIEKARIVFTTSLKKKTLDAEIFYYLAQCFEHDGRDQEAVAYYQKALACIPNYLGIRPWFQRYLLFDQDPKPYDRIFVSDIYERLANGLYRAGQYEDSLLAVDASLNFNRYNQQAIRIKKSVHLKLNQSEQCSVPRVSHSDSREMRLMHKDKLSILIITNYTHKLKKNRHLSPPGTGLLETTYQSLLDVFGPPLERSRKILCFDRKSSNNKKEIDYQKNLELFCHRHNFDLMIKDHCGLQGIIIYMLEQIATPYLFFLEHDWEFIPPRIDLVNLLHVFESYLNIHYVRFNKRENKISNFDYLMENETLIRGVDLIRTSAHSNNPFIARVDKMRKDWLPLCKKDPLCKKIDLKGTAFGFENPLFKYHMEDIRENGFDKAHEKWGTYVFGKPGDPARIVHLGE